MTIEHALPFQRCTSSDLFKITGEAPEGFLEDSDAYLSAFVAPVKGDDGQARCFHCGEVIDSFSQMFGTGVAYEWGLAHGEARCSGCKWPARGMHYPKGRDGTELYSVRNLFLAYHPDFVERRDNGSSFLSNDKAEAV